MHLIIKFLLIAITYNAFARDADQTTVITANHAEFDDATGIAHYIGNVELEQGTRYLNSSDLKITRGKDNKVSKALATGTPAKFKAKTTEEKQLGFGEANTIDYYPHLDKVVLIGNAKLTQAGDTVTGEHLIYFFDENKLISHKTEQRTTVTLSVKK